MSSPKLLAAIRDIGSPSTPTIVALKGGRVGLRAKCPHCGAPTVTVPPAHSGERSRPIHENADGQPHALTCSARVTIAQVTRRAKGKGLDALLPAVKK
jgi:hypothetical protein